jgi:hypothetical protein
MPEKDLHLFDQTRLHAHDRRDKPGDDGVGWVNVSGICSKHSAYSTRLFWTPQSVIA